MTRLRCVVALVLVVLAGLMTVPASAQYYYEPYIEFVDTEGTVNGPVKSCLVEWQELSSKFEGGWSPRLRHTYAEYSPLGYEVELVVYESVRVNWHALYSAEWSKRAVLGPDGKPSRIMRFEGEFTTLTGISIPKYDGSRLVEEKHFTPSMEHFATVYLAYDKQGRLVQVKECRPDGTCVQKYEMTYDTDGNIARRIRYICDRNGKLLPVEESQCTYGVGQPDAVSIDYYTYDYSNYGKKVLSSSVWFVPEKYDRYGNWVQETVYEFDVSDYHVKKCQTAYRTIEYYE